MYKYIYIYIRALRVYRTREYTRTRGYGYGSGTHFAYVSEYGSDKLNSRLPVCIRLYLYSFIC